MPINHPITQDQAMEIAYTGARCVAALVQPDGRFIYKTVDGYAPPEYNLLRHCGTVWSIADVVAARGNMVPEIKAAKRAMAMIMKERLKPLSGGLCVSGGKTTKLGGAGLAILALVKLNEFDTRHGYLKTANALADFIVAQQRDDGDFHHKLKVKTGKVMKFRSDYYTGEALFGLVELFKRMQKRDVLLTTAQSSIDALRARDYGVAEQSHWMAYALSALHSVTGEQSLVDYAGAICAGIIDDPAYRARGRSAPTATRIEALMAYADMLQRNGNVTSGPAFDDVMNHSSTDIAELLKYRQDDGSFWQSEHENIVQIDYIQHAVSAFLGYHRNYGGAQIALRPGSHNTVQPQVMR